MHDGCFCRSDFEQQPISHANIAQLPRIQQEIHRVLHPRTRYKITKEQLNFLLVRGNHAIQIFRDQEGKRFAHRDFHAFANRVRRPAVQNVPGRTTLVVVVDSSDAKTRPQFTQRVIQGDERNTATQIFAHLLLRNRALALNERKSVRSQLRIFRSRARFWWLLGIAISGQRIKIRKDGSGDQKRVFVE